MRSLLFATAPLAVALLAACEPAPTGPDADSFARHLPDERILVAMPVAGDRAVGDLAETYLTTAQVTTVVNGLIGMVLDTVDHITDFEPTWTEDENKFLWGPWNDGGLDPNQTALYVELDEAAGVYGWAIIQRPKTSTSDEDWVPVIGGEATPGATEDTGSGAFVIDFDAIAALNPAETATGAFVSTYTIHEDGHVEAEAGFQEFTDGGSEVVNAGYRYGQDLTGAGYMDLAYLAELDGNPLEETVVIRSRWTAEGAGRGDVVILGGDIDPLIFHAYECWDTSYLVVYEESNLDLTMNGDASLCAFSEPEWNEDAPAE